MLKRSTYSFLVLLFAVPLFGQVTTTKHVIDSGLSGGFWIYTTDLDQDGDIDIVATSLNAGVKWYKNNGGSFAKNTIASSFPDSWSVHAADLDNDLDLDVVACSGGSEDWTGPSETSWWENDGNENFTTKRVIDNNTPDASHPHSVFAADLDKDGDNDVVIAAWQSDKIVWWENLGSRVFTQHILDSNFSSGHSVYATDLDKDGKVDVAAGGGSKTAWYRNTGNGNFTKNVVASGGAFCVFPIDVDKDGSLDILRDQRDNFDVDWLKGPNFSERTVQSAWGESWGIVGGDLDLDGDIDVFGAGFVNNEVSYWLNDGSNNFTEFSLESSITRPRGVSLADFDEDGDLDMALVTRQGTLAWYEVTGVIGGGGTALTLVSPNGGETLTGGTTHNITWTSSGATSAVKLEYSTDGGASYTEIIASTANDGSHAWLVPALNTNQALVRISDATDGVPSDVSNTFFSITTASLTLISPNGGETLSGGGTHNITWTFSGTVSSIKLEYSPNGGVTYNEIVESTANDGSHSWSVPAINTSLALVRISDASDGVPSDVSNSTFSIQTQALTLTSPNGGESWLGGSTQNITWTSTGIISFVKLEYSIDNGTSFTTIVPSTANDGSHSWSVPAVNSTQALVRISDASDGVPSDVSNAVFTIDNQSLTVTSPNGGESFEGGSIQNISWSSSGNISSVKLEYSTNNGATFTEIVNSTPNDGSHTWTVPFINTTQGVIKISDAADGTPTDVSNSVFSIVTPGLTMIFPNGSEILTGGSTESITWNSTGNISSVNLEYSANNGGTWTVIVTSAPNTGSFNWLVPAINTTQGLLRIADAADGNPTDVSNSVFTIDTQSLTLTAPNGSESWLAGSVQNITWTSTGSIQAVKLEYSIDSGGVWTEIIDSTPNDGSHSWGVPIINSSTALIRISDASDGTPTDISNNVFTIDHQTLTLTAPNGGENWLGGSTQAVTWASTGNIQAVKLEYSANNGISWGSVITSTANDGSYNWNVPNISSNQVLVRILDAADDTPADTSDSQFTITSSSVNATLTVTSPNGGEIWTGESVKKVTWSSTGTLGSVKLEYSANNGISWTTIVNSTANSGDYNWTVPDIATSSAVVRISNAALATPSDISDNIFTIIRSGLSVISPNGGETWDGNSDQMILWSSTGVFASVKIEYSIDNGGTWTTVAPNASNIGSYSWKVPNLESDQTRLRISDAADGTPADMSDAAFRIVQVITDVSISPDPNSVPKDFVLSQNYPNPFNLDTRIEFGLPVAAKVQLVVYNLKGGLIQVLFSGDLLPGNYAASWNGLDKSGLVVTSGVYIYTIRIGAWQASRKLLLVK